MIMRSKSLTFTPAKKIIYVAFLLCLTFGACKKVEKDNNVYGAIAIVNAAPTVATYDFYLNGSKTNSVPIPAGGAMPYSQKVTGNYDLKFTISGRTESLFAKNITIAPNAYQTYYLVGRPATLDGFMIIDDRSQVSTTQAFVRFVNASPDAPALDLYQGTIAFATNKAFKAYGGYVAINAGSYTFDIKETANGSVKATTENYAFLAGGYYTIMAKGLIAPAAGGIELPLSAAVMINK
ncbi:MAG: DUF4397 domain-containing protein [Pedobacter sp.]|nr:DUF4397 domain-containing protein [Pedobacter sp.]MDQ8054530.1 DUF4397 domain-containing protein [Pedobacter sp.]